MTGEKEEFTVGDIVNVKFENYEFTGPVFAVVRASDIVHMWVMQPFLSTPFWGQTKE